MGKVIQFPSGLSRHVKVTVFYDTSRKVFDVRADSGKDQGKIVGKTVSSDGKGGIYLSNVSFGVENNVPVIKGTYLGESYYYHDDVSRLEVAEFKNGRWVAKSNDFTRSLEEARMVSIFGDLIVIDIAHF